MELIENETGPSDTELLRAYQRGDRKAFDTIYRRHRDRLFLYARSRTRDDGAAEDLVHETFYRALQSSASRGVEAESLGPFLFTVLRRLSIDYARSQEALVRRERNFRGKWVEAAEPRLDATTVDEINRALKILPPEQLEAVVLRIWGGLTFAQSAEVVECPAKTIMSRYSAGLDKLLRVLKDLP